MSVLEVYKVFRTFVNTLTCDHKYSLGNREILLQQIQFKLSKKLNFFCQVFPAFLKSTFSFEHLKKNVEPYNLCISEIIGGGRRVYVSL